MEISYKREMNHNYLILSSPDWKNSGYECKMLAGNCIDGLLKFRLRNQEDGQKFYYEITSKQPLSRLAMQKPITGGEVRRILFSISSVLERIEEYLLKEDQILLEPDYIYIEPDFFQVYFCVIPGYSCNFFHAITKLFQYLLEKINHRDKDGVVLIYNLYHESLKENYSMSDLLRFLSETNKEKVIENESDKEEWIGEFEEEKNDFCKGQLEPEKKESYKTKNFIESKERPARNFSLLLQLGNWLIITLGMELFLWGVTGEEGLSKYGLWGALGSFLLFLVKQFYCASLESRADVKVEKKTERDVKQRLEKKSEDIVRKETREELYSRNEYARKEISAMQWEQEMDRKEEETTLLANFEDSDSMVILESLGRERENIMLPYIPFVIGKHEDLVDYCLPHPTISRIHAKIDRKEEDYLITDLNSTNGTTVDGHLLQANETVSVKDGGLIYFADIGYRFCGTGTENVAFK